MSINRFERDFPPRSLVCALRFASLFHKPNSATASPSTLVLYAKREVF